MTGAPAKDKPRPWSLDLLNFSIADARGAIGPYLNVFLITARHWSQGEVGLVTMIGGFAGLAVQTPIGAAIDRTKAKRALLIASLAVLALGAFAIFAFPRFWPVMIANALIASVGDVFSPAIAAITVGLVTRRVLARRLGRNSAFSHAGNAFIALAAAGVGTLFSQREVFLLVPAFALLAMAATLSIPAGAINHNRARGLQRKRRHEPHPDAPAGLLHLLTIRPLLIFCFCMLLFSFANAPLLGFVGQKLAFGHPGYATVLLSASIITAQLTMIPTAAIVGRTADSWGHKKLFLIAFGILPLRAALDAFLANSLWLIGVEVLDGIGSGVAITLTPLLLADLMRGTGRYNLSQGVVGTVKGIGASVSSFAAALIVGHMGYTTAFLALSGVAALAFACFLLLMPETLDWDEEADDEPPPA